MVFPLIKKFTKEKIVRLNPLKLKRLPFSLKGVVRIIDNKGEMKAVVIDEEVWSEFLEYLEYSSPKFWEEIESSRKSGRVPSAEIKKRLKLK